MGINVAWMFRFGAASGFACASQDRLDNLFPQDKQSGHFLQTLGHGLVASGVFDFSYQVFAPEFLQVIGSLASGVMANRACLYFGSQVCGLESVWSGSQRDHSFQNSTHSRLVDIHTADTGLTDLGRFGQLIQDVVRDNRDINTVQGIEETIQNVCQAQDNLGKLGQRAATAQIFCVVNNNLSAQDAFAFGIHLDGDLSKVKLEDRQVILRSLDHDLATRFLLAFAPGGTLFASEDGLQGLDVEQGAGAVNGTLKNLLHLTASHEQQVTAVFFLIDRVIVVEASPFLLGQVQCKGQAGRINPTLANCPMMSEEHKVSAMCANCVASETWVKQLPSLVN